MSEIFIKLKELESVISNFITSGECDKVLKSTQNGDKQDVKDGFILGLCWSSILASCSVEHLTAFDIINSLNKTVVTKDTKKTAEKPCDFDSDITNVIEEDPDFFGSVIATEDNNPLKVMLQKSKDKKIYKQTL